MTAETPVTGGEALDASRMPLLDHLIELRSRLLKSVLALAVAFGVCFYFVKPIYTFLVAPLVRAGQPKLIYIEMFEAFFVELKVALFAAFMLAFPVIANQLWKFVAPGLYSKEKRALLPFLLATPILFTAGAASAYYGAVPIALTFLLGFGGEFGGVSQEASPTASSYLSFVMHFMMAFGICFLLPILLLLLERAGIVSRQQLVGARRYMIVGAFAIAAVATPPDVLSQFLLAVPIILLYEVSILIMWFTQRRRSQTTEQEEASPAA